jgi:hypothetical protein
MPSQAQIRTKLWRKKSALATINYLPQLALMDHFSAAGKNDGNF